MRTGLASAREAFLTRLWPIPTLAVVVALLLGLGMPELDSAIDGQLSTGVKEWVFGGDADAARSLLGAIASSLITVTSLTFSLTVVTLQLASSQFSPRLLRTFTSDQFVQTTLALFLATFTYSLTVLRAVRSASEGGNVEFVPRAAVTLAFVFAVASVLGLVLFLAHLTAQIRVETMLRQVHSDASRTVRAALDERDAVGASSMPAPPENAVALPVSGDGFLTSIDESGLLRVAVEEELLLRLDAHPGSFLVDRTPMGCAWAADGRELDEETVGRVAGQVADCVHTGYERTAAQDVGYGLRQLTDVANKALSPGINDPTTAIHALGHISSLLCSLTDYDLGPRVLRDGDDRERVLLLRPDLATFVELGISQPRRYGASDPQVMERLFELLRDLSHRVAPDQRGVVRDQLERLRATVAAQEFDATERASLAELGRQVERNLR